MKVLIELPDKWLDMDHSTDLFWMTRTVKEEVEEQVRDKVVEEVMKHTKLPKITINAEEIKDRMLTILAKRALEKQDE